MKYSPGILPEDPKALVPSLSLEYKKIQDTIDQIHQHDIVHVAPAKPRVGQVEYADGTNWNPGSGEGPYIYTSTGWVFLAAQGGSSDTVVYITDSSSRSWTNTTPYYWDCGTQTIPTAGYIVLDNIVGRLDADVLYPCRPAYGVQINGTDHYFGLLNDNSATAFPTYLTVNPGEYAIYNGTPGTPGMEGVMGGMSIDIGHSGCSTGSQNMKFFVYEAYNTPSARTQYMRGDLVTTRVGIRIVNTA